MIVAGAGSGKTRVLTYKIAFLIESGISPFEILALTFTMSSQRRPTSCIPMGRPASVKPQGILRAGKPVRLTGRRKFNMSERGEGPLIG